MIVIKNNLEMRKLNKILKKSKKVFIDDDSKIVIMSDCHRGDGSNSDNFMKNELIFLKSLNYYDKNGFMYIELGDGDEMWEVKDYPKIIEVHIESFRKLKKFHDSNRLIMIYGNHDILKKSPYVLKQTFSKYKLDTKEESLLENLKVYESLILNYKNHDLFLIHGHQVDFLNSTLWMFSRFLVRYIWKTLENIGLKDPTGTSKNHGVTKNTEKKLQEWSKINHKILIAGHTHRAVFPNTGESMYFNDGSCIHPNGITALEIENGNITLVKWEKEKFSITRKIIEGNQSILSFYK